MSDMREQLRAIEVVPPPDLWPDIGSRRPGPEPRDTRARLIAATVALVVALSGVGVATWAFVGKGKPVPSVTATSQPSEPTASSPAPTHFSGLALDWSANVGGQANGVAVANGVAYVRTDQGVVAIDARSGAELWRRTLFGSVANAPAVSGDVVIAIDDGAPLLSGAGATVWALDARTGATRWSKTIGHSRAQYGFQFGAGLSAPVVNGGLLFLGSNFGPMAIDLTTGRIVWETHTAETRVSTPTVADGRVYVAAAGSGNAFPVSNPGNHLYAFDEQSGKEIWTAQLDGAPGTPAVADGTVFVSTMYEFWLSAFDQATGALRWRVGGGTSADAFSDPAVAEGVVYVGHGTTVDGYRVSSGLHLWSAQAGSLGYTFQIPAIANGVLYASAAADGHVLYVFRASGGEYPFTDSTGELLDVVSVPPSVLPGAAVSPPVVADGHVFVTAGGVLDAFLIVAT